MGESLEDLAGIEGLAPRDEVIARALIRNGLVEAGAVIGAARAAAAGSPGDVLDHLTAAGVLDPEKALRIEEALERKIAQKCPPAAEPAGPPADEPDIPDVPDVPEAPSRSAASKRDQSWKRGGRSGKTTVMCLEALREDRARRERDDLQLFIERFVRSRLHESVLAFLAPRRESIVEARDVAKRAGVEPKAVARILEDWKSKGILKAWGTFPYYFDPAPQDREQIDRFMRAWKDPAQHAHILTKILELEGR